jgi:glycerophosphoryl diester phosphodiesterase
MINNKIFISILLLFSALVVQAQEISSNAKEIQEFMPGNAVIAHRGTIFWAPELTEASFRWARNMGADYLELDVHQSKDGVLVVMHDRSFNRTTDVAQKFPGREKDYIETFTFEEIMQLDNGLAFNTNSPEQARESFVGLNVLTFEDVFRIAEGKKIKRNADGSRAYHKDSEGKYIFEYEPDPADNGNRPGVYIEVKYSEYYPGIEEQIYKELTYYGWNPLEGEKIADETPFYLKGKVNIGNTRGKILLQTFSREGMQNIKRVFQAQVLASFLVSSPTLDASDREAAMEDIINFAMEVDAQFIGTNLEDGNKGLRADFAEKIHRTGLKINVYSFNTLEQMGTYFGPGKGKKVKPMADGMITNRADLTIQFYNKRAVRKIKSKQSPENILIDLGYTL